MRINTPILPANKEVGPHLIFLEGMLSLCILVFTIMILTDIEYRYINSCSILSKGNEKKRKKDSET